MHPTLPKVQKWLKNGRKNLNDDERAGLSEASNWAELLKIASKLMLLTEISLLE